MDVAVFKIDLTGTLDSIKAAIGNADKRILALLGFTAGSFAFYRALESVSMSGKTEREWLRKMHDVVRVYWNSGCMMRHRHFFHDPKMFIVNYGSYGVAPKPVLQYKLKMQVRMC